MKIVIDTEKTFTLPRKSSRLGLIPLLAVSLVSLLHSGAEDWQPFGFGWHRFGLTLAEGTRTEAAGPFYYNEKEGGKETWALPPLFSSMRDPELETLEQDFAYPLLTYDRYGGQYRWQFFQLLSFAGGASQTETNRDRFTIFPFYFQQRSSDTNENYTAVLPFYGHLKHRLMRDEVSFVMLPFYVQSRKKDVVTDNYFYPFYHTRHGDGLNGWQIWPFYGTEHKDVTIRTNIWNEPEKIAGHDRVFVLWPFFHDSHADIGMENPEWQQALLPVYSLVRSPKRDVTTVAWPFFSRVDDREKKYREWQLPYPFVVFAHGEGKTTRRVWPFFSQAHSAILESDFYLWPLYKYNRANTESLERERTRILFFLYSDTVERNKETKKFRQRTDVWPLFAHRRDYDGNTRLQVLALLEPLLPGAHKVERDYSPVWSLWRSEKNPRTGATSQSLLWNLYRRETSSGRTRISAFFGLYRYQKTASGKEIRLFSIPLSHGAGSQK